MYVTAERIILLDTQPVLSWSVLEHTLRYGTTDGLPADIWRDLKVSMYVFTGSEMEADNGRQSLHSIMFLLAISDVVLVVSEGADADFDMLRCLKRADMLKHGIPEFPLIPPEKLGLSRPEINVQPHIGKPRDKAWHLRQPSDRFGACSFCEQHVPTFGVLSASV